MNIVVAQFYTKNVDYAEYTTKINKLYCEKHGYTYYAETDTDKITTGLQGRAPTWYKPKLIQTVLTELSPDYVLFLDIDAVFVDFEDKIENYIDEEYDLLFTEDYSSHSNMNAGVCLVKNTEWTRQVMQTWWDTGDTLVGKEIPNWEVPEIHCAPGYFKNALWHDQSCLAYLYQNNSEFKAHTKIISNRKLNWREPFDSNFIFHAFAYGTAPYRNLQYVHSKLTNTPISIDINETDLLDVAGKFPTDKEHGHKYFTRVYNKWFPNIKNTVKTILEIGVLDGGSLAIWKNYFKEAKVIGIDNNPDCGMIVAGIDGIDIKISDTGNRNDLQKLQAELSSVDIIIDDGGHRMDQQQLALAYLLPSTAPGGLYIIEDLHTSTEAKMPEKQIFNWGDPNKTTTLDMLRHYQQTGKIVSDYLTNEECEMLESMIDSLVIYDDCGEYNSILAVIQKTVTKEINNDII